jgi:hypothetical protein
MEIVLRDWTVLVWFLHNRPSRTVLEYCAAVIPFLENLIESDNVRVRKTEESLHLSHGRRTVIAAINPLSGEFSIWVTRGRDEKNGGRAPRAKLILESIAMAFNELSTGCSHQMPVILLHEYRWNC